MLDLSSFIIYASILVLAFIMPTAILLGRDNVKARRQEIIRQLETFFEDKTRPDQNPSDLPAKNSESTSKWNVLPSFEFVKTKYLLDSTSENRRSEFDLRWFSLPVLIFVLLSFCGFIVTFLPQSEQCYNNTQPVSVRCVVISGAGIFSFFGGDVGIQEKKFLGYLVAFAFLGAYVASVKNLLRSVANFDLSPLTFFRCSLWILTSTITIVAIWRGSSSLDLGLGINGQFSSFWIFAAFMFGIAPNLGERLAISFWRRGKIKQMDDAATDRTKIIPLELVDGIDGDIRARLEDFNLFDVQNLATANPILLFVETPFGIYQSIDWVAQAQLAAAFGVTKTLDLRGLGIRTIFDLEEAMLSEKWVDAPPNGLEVAISRILLGSELFSASGNADSVIAARRLVYIAADDLATRRLRQIWDVIEGKLSPHAPKWPRKPDCTSLALTRDLE